MDDRGKEADRSTAIHVGAGGRIGDITVQGDVAGRDIVKITEDLSYDVGDLGQNPYLGLASYTYATRAYFGGRDQQVREAVRRLTAVGSEPVLVLVTGASGSGKSSFVQAGLIPALEASYQAAGYSVRWSVARPGRHPLAALGRAFHGVGIESVPDLRTPADFEHVLASGSPANQVSVVVIDQFEELFTQSEPDERDTVLAALAQLASFERLHTHFIATMRADYLPSLFESAALFELAKRDGIELRVMESAELGRAIRRPLQEQARLESKDQRLQPALVERLIEDVEASGPGVLPLLQVTLAALWDQPPHRLTVDRYRSLTDALEEQADRVYARNRQGQERTPAEQAMLMGILLDLVDVSFDDDVHHDVRRTVPKQELVRDDPRRADLLEELIEARLISTWMEQRGTRSVELVDIIHETLLTNWTRLRTSIHEQRDLLQRRARFRLAVQEWERNARADEYLLRGGRLADALEWQAEGDVALSPSEQAFLAASSALQDAEQHAARRRTRITIGTLVAVLVVISGLAVVALSQQQEAVGQKQNADDTARTAVVLRQVADENAQTAVALGQVADQNAQTAIAERDRANAERDTATSRELAASALSTLSVDPELSVLLAARAEAVTATQEAELALRRSLVGSPIRAALLDQGQAKAGVKRQPQSIAFSPDGTRLIVGYSDATTQILDTASRQFLAELPGPPIGIGRFTSGSEPVRLTSRPFSPDGQRVLVSSGKNEVQVWDIPAGHIALAATLTGHTDEVLSAAFEPVHGSRIVTSSKDGTIRLWNATTGELQLSVPVETDQFHFYQAAFNADGSRVLASGSLRLPRVWDATTGQEMGHLPPSTTSSLTVAFSPDGTRMAADGDDNSVRVWRVDDGQLLATMTGHTDPVDSIAFSPAGTRLLTASFDDTVRVWDASTGQEKTSPMKLQRFTGSLPGQGTLAAFSPDGGWVAATSVTDPALQIFDAATGREVASVPTTRQFVFSPIGRDVATLAVSDVRLWHPSVAGEEVTVCCGASTAALSPDGTRLVTLDADRVVRAWDGRDGRQLPLSAAALPDRISVSGSPILNQDATRILFAADNRTLQVRDLSSGQEFALAHSANIAGFFFADPRRILSASQDGTLLAWDAATGRELAHIKESSAATFRVLAGAFSGDGARMLAANLNAGDKAAVQAWQDATGWQLIGLPAGVRNLNVASLSADGSRLATRSGDNGSDNLQVWNTRTGMALLSVNRRTDPRTLGIAHLALNADGTRLLASTGVGTASLWEVDTQTALNLTHTPGDVQSALFTADGNRVITSGDDGTLRVWDARTGAELLKLDLSAPVMLIATSHDGRSVVGIEKSAGGQTGAVRVFGCEVMCPVQDLRDLVPMRTTRQLTPQEQHQFLHTQT